MTTRTTPDRWRMIEEIFQHALERPSGERTAYIADACGGDEALRSEIQSLLAQDGSTGALRAMVADDLTSLVDGHEYSESGLQLGRYRVVRELDSGGMGVVYLAVRSDDQYFQIVAIKTIRKGLESPELIERFRAERQTLAALTHPNIGAILDGGNTDDGRPFMVMEYVEGQPITVACESGNVPLPRRIEIFRSVCAAVHYAHQKLVIHRDLKPSNILVTPEGVVKLIDFGIAKPIASELTPGDQPTTDVFHRFMTPDYASPEQLHGESLTTATDIYSLGVVLFELLTRSRPYSLRGLSPASAERLVSHEEGWKPSSVPDLVPATRKYLTGDLDRIVLMAMDKDPSRRYRSAQHLEEDLVRFLQGMPVSARKATLTYRLRKFARRHATASLMAGTAAVILSGSIMFGAAQSRLASHRVEHVEALANAAISDMTTKLQQTSVSTELQASMFHSALAYLEQLRKSSGNDPRVLLELSKAYGRVGDLEGSPFVANLGNSTNAVASYEAALHTALEARARLPGEQSTATVVEAYQRLGRMQSSLGMLQAAADNYQASLSVAREFWQQKPDDPSRRRLFAMNYFGLGEVQLNNREPDNAIATFRSALQILGGELNGNEDHDLTLARLAVLMGRALNEVGPHADALVYFMRSIEVAEDLARRSPPARQGERIMFAAYYYIVGPLAGEELLNVGDVKEAQIYAHKALAIAEALAARDRKNAQARTDLAYAYWAMGNAFRTTQPAVAAEWYRKCLALTKEMGADPQALHLVALRDEALAAVLVDKRHATERLQLLEEANGLRLKLARTDPALPEYHRGMMRSDCLLSEAELAAHDLAHATRSAAEVLPFLGEFTPASHSLMVLRDIGRCYESLGRVQRRIAVDRSFSPAERRRAAEASQQWYQKSADVWHEWDRRGGANPESDIEERRVERVLRSTQ